MPDDVAPTTLPVIDAFNKVHTALSPLEAADQMRVIRWVAELLNLPLTGAATAAKMSNGTETRIEHTAQAPSSTPEDIQQPNDDEDGISPVALKWMRRSGLTVKALEPLFSFGIDEIDLIAKSVPGEGPKAKMRSVMLLKGIASYLSGGAARMNDDEIRQACVHYNALDNTNFSKYVKAFSSEVGGSKEAGYTLTPRGISDATDLIKSMIKE